MQIEFSGLSPQLLHQVLEHSQAPQSAQTSTASSSSHDQLDPSESSSNAFLPRVIYELDTTSNELRPRLRLRTYDGRFIPSVPVVIPSQDASNCRPEMHTFGPETQGDATLDAPQEVLAMPSAVTELREVVIPLPSDSMFVQTLIHAHQSLSERLTVFCKEFYANLDTLAREVSETARPMSETSPSFHAHSSHSNATMVRVRGPGGIRSLWSSKSDLYAWREILQLYMDSEVFESTHEESRGERAIEDAEERLAAFMQRLAERGLSTGSRMKLKQSRHAMSLFLQMNASILNLYKVFLLMR